jgi:hypothetical protein
VTSQLPVASWHQQIGDPTLADSILDRLVHNAYRIELSGNPFAKRKGGARWRIDREVAHERGPVDSQAAHRLVCGRAGSGASAGVAFRPSL